MHNIAEHPISNDIYFNESWESKNFAHRKRYKGDYNPNIKSYNRNTGSFTQHTDYDGKDFGATIDRNGRVYFMCDEANGEYNLYTFKDGIKSQLTDFGSSIYWPKVSANGTKVVFRKDYQIHVYDVVSGTTSTPDIKLFTNQTLTKDVSFKVEGNISAFNASPDNKKLAFISRGRMFISDIKGKFIKEITTESQEAVGEVHWLKDSKTLLFTQSRNEYYN